MTSHTESDPAAVQSPDASAAYEQAVRRDLAEVQGRIREVVVLLETMDDALRLLPRTRSSCAGWRKLLADMEQQVATEQDDVTAAVRGSREAITENVNVELGAAVVELRRPA